MKVRLYQYKSWRHYGGREITTIPHIVDAEYLYQQEHTVVVRLGAAAAGYPAGHVIAIQPRDVLE